MIDIITGTDGVERLTGTESRLGQRIAAAVGVLCLGGAVWGGVYWGQTHPKAVGVVDATASVDAVRAADAQWAKAATAHDVEGTIGFYSDDAIVMPPNSPMVKDKASVRKAWAEILVPGAEISWNAGKVEASKDGDIVYDVGMYTLITKASKGKPQTTDGGKYLAVWKKQADGSWKSVAASWSSDKAVSARPRG